MNRKITLLALAVKCGCFGAMGFVKWLFPSAAKTCLPRKPSCESIDVRATEAKPQPDSQRNSRRVRPQNWRPGEEGWDELKLGMVASVFTGRQLNSRKPRRSRHMPDRNRPDICLEG